MQTRQRTPRVAEPLGESRAVRALRREIAAVAPVESTVLVTGETGAGKGVVAREIHRCSRRRGAFVHVDCAALAPGLIESELFGHERGAFTGASTARAGRFERAAGGTLFLDEIGELEPALQAVLLRVLQDREFERLGGGRTQRMRARVIAATSRDLRRDVPEGRFRADLYFRLAVVRLDLPPLRERRGDIPLLTRAFLEELARRLELPAPQVGEGCIARLCAHPWPGNVRELRNVLERALVRSAGRRLEALDLGELDEPLWASGAAGAASPAPPAEQIAAVLRVTGGNVARAARELGLPRTTLRRRMRLYGLEPPGLAGPRAR